MKKFCCVFFITILFAIAAFAQEKTDRKASQSLVSASFKSDGCTWFPDGNYTDCCVEHDRAYYAGGSWTQRWRADRKLFRCVATKPKFYNRTIATMMWLGVRIGGVPWLKTPFRWGFGQPRKSQTNLSTGR